MNPIIYYLAGEMDKDGIEPYIFLGITISFLVLGMLSHWMDNKKKDIENKIKEGKNE